MWPVWPRLAAATLQHSAAAIISSAHPFPRGPSATIFVWQAQCRVVYTCTPQRPVAMRHVLSALTHLIQRARAHRRRLGEGEGRPTAMAGLGLVSRASPVHTALRNCIGDEGGPFGFGDQVADPKPPRAAVAKSHGREHRGKVGA